jgi:hypothetical protein
MGEKRKIRKKMETSTKNRRAERKERRKKKGKEDREKKKINLSHVCALVFISM